MRKLGTIVCVLILTTAAVASADQTARIDPATATGIRLDVQQDPADPLAARCGVEFLRASNSATIRITGPAELIAADLAFSPADDQESTTSDPMAVAAGDRYEVLLALSEAADDRPVAVIVERADGETVFQATVALRFDGADIHITEQVNYRVDNRRLAAGDGVITVEHLGPKLATTGTINVADTVDHDIPDGPTDCTGSVWPLHPILSVSSAPSGSVTTSVSLHLVVVHPVMSDLQLILWKEFNTYAGYLWYNAAGTNLDQTFTSTSPSQVPPGVGQDPNGLWILGARDCYAGDVGYIDRWSLEIQYDGGGTDVDLEADYVNVDPTSIEDGHQVEVSWRGVVGGTDPVGGNFTVGHYLSTDNNITTLDTLLTSTVVSSAQDPGDSFGAWSPGQMITIPGGTAAGTYYLGMIIDPPDDIAETNENNNRAWAQLEVTNGGGGGGGGGGGSQPNLTVMPCSAVPVDPDAGGLVTLTWRAFNDGDADSGAFRWGVYFSEDASLDPATDTRLTQDNEANWPVGHDSGFRLTSFTIPGNLADGTYNLMLKLDDLEAVNESDETDNICSAQIAVPGTITPPGPQPVTRWLVPAAASAPGYGTSNWKTQIAIVNPLQSTRNASLYYVANGQPWPGVLLSGPIAIGPTDRAFFDDVLATLNPAQGLLYVMLDDPGPVVTSRTYNLEAGGATFGQGIPAVGFEGVTPPDELILPMVHTNPGGFHTNLGVVHAAAGNLQIQVRVYNAAGANIGTKTYNQAAAWKQINDVFNNMGLGDQNIQGGWIRVTRTAGSGFWTCYASVVDDQTNDPTYVAPVEVIE